MKHSPLVIQEDLLKLVLVHYRGPGDPASGRRYELLGPVDQAVLPDKSVVGVKALRRAQGAQLP